MLARLVLCGMACGLSVSAATVLTIQVSNYSEVPIRGVILSSKFSSSTSAPSDVAGKTQIVLAQDVQPGDQVPLVLVQAPSPKLRIFAPFEGRAIVPKQFFIEVVLGEPGDRLALKNENVLESLAGAINSEAIKRPNTPLPEGVKGGPSLEFNFASSLKQVAGAVGVEPKELDAAIRKLARNKQPKKHMEGIVRYDAAVREDRMKAILYKNRDTT